MASVEFWYEFASTYSYPAAMQGRGGSRRARRNHRMAPLPARTHFRRCRMARSRRSTSIQTKGRYMWRDIGAHLRVPAPCPFVRPDPFPQNGLIAARIALTLDVPARAEFFTRGVSRRVRQRAK